MRLVVCVHDGLYGCGTGAGFGNWRFLQCLQLHRHLVDELFILPVRVTSTSAEFDHRWHHRARNLLDGLGAELLPVDNGSGGRRRYGGIKEWITASREAAGRIREIRSSDLRVVSFDTPFAGLLALIREQPQLRHVHIPRSTGLLHTPGDRQRAAWERFHYAQADGCSALLGAISTFMRRHLETVYRVCPPAIMDIFDGATRFEWTYAEQACPLELSGDRFILCYGRAHPYKGQHLLLDALALLRSRGIRAPPAVIGAVSESPVNPYADDLERRVQETLIDAVIVPRFGLWLRDLIGHPDLTAVVVPSMVEPFGRIPMECYTHPDFRGVVVASTAGGLPETVVHNVTGFGFDRGCASSLATALERALTSAPETRQTMKAKAITLMRDGYDYEDNVRHLLELLSR